MHRRELETRFRATRNPVLIAQCEGTRRRRSRRRDESEGGGEYEAVPTTIAPFAEARFATLPSATAPELGVADSEELVQTVLGLVVKRTRSRNAYFYVCTEDGLRLVWSSTNVAPPREQLSELERFLDIANEEAAMVDATADSTHVFDNADGHHWRLVALRQPEQGRIIGGLLLEAGIDFDSMGATDVLNTLCRVIEDRGPDAFDFVTV
jgi:hypothetical protein